MESNSIFESMNAQDNSNQRSRAESNTRVADSTSDDTASIKSDVSDSKSIEEACGPLVS